MLAELENRAAELDQFLCMLHVAVARSSDTLCTSGFMDDVIILYHRTNWHSVTQFAR